jgi:hypothetical protein
LGALKTELGTAKTMLSGAKTVLGADETRWGCGKAKESRAYTAGIKQRSPAGTRRAGEEIHQIEKLRHREFLL